MRPGANFLIPHLLSSVAVVLAAAPSHAQYFPVELDPIIVNGNEQASADAEDGFVPKTSSVGTKSTLPISRTPQSISVVTADELEQRQVENLSEALRYTPGVSTQLYGDDPRSDWFRVRGFSAPEYLDGLKLARGQFAWPRVDPYFLNRVEVLKGPSGSLYGQTPPGGLVNLVSKKPTEQTVQQVGLRLGSPEQIEGFADFGGKLTEDGRFTYRLTGIARNADTRVDFVNDDRTGLMGGVTWRPTDATSLTLQAYVINDNAKSIQFLPALGTIAPNPNGEIPRDRFTGEPDWDNYDLKQNMIGYQFDHEFENGLKLSSKLRWSDVDYDLKVARPFGFVSGSNELLFRRAVGITDKTKATNADNNLIYSFDTGAVRHTLIAGVDYLTQKTDFDFSVGSIRPINVYNPVYGATPSPLFPVTQTQTDLRQTGLYLQDQIEVSNWTIMLSARNDWYDLDSLNEARNVRTENSGNEFTWRAGTVYSFDNGVSPYVSYATSFEPLAGVNTTTGNPLEPTKSKQTEVGLKYAPEGTNALFTLAAFDLRQQNTVVNTGLIQSQIGESRVRGVEMEGRIALNNGLSLLASYTYLDAEITNGSAATQGNKLPFVPENQASIWASYDLDGALVGLTLAGGLRYMGTTFGSTRNDIEIGDYLLADLAISYDLGAKNPSFEGARIDLSIANLTDKKYVSTCDNATACYWGAGRTLRGSFVYNF